MPVYLCKPGWGTAEPWRHGIPVYAYPFPMNEDSHANAPNNDSADDSSLDYANAQLSAGGESRTSSTRMGTRTRTTRMAPNMQNFHNNDNVNADVNLNNIHAGARRRVAMQDDSGAPENRAGGMGSASYRDHDNNRNPSAAAANFYSRSRPGIRSPQIQSRSIFLPSACIPIRRVRHSEVVLVDEVSVHYNKYWLRLRWPGSRGGVAGYIVLGGTNSVPNDRVREWKERLRGAVGGIEGAAAVAGDALASLKHATPEENEQEDNDNDFEENNNDSDNESMTDGHAILRHVGESNNSPSHFAPRCESTGLYFPSTTTMELLAMYDDGIDSPTPSASSLAGDQTEDEGDAGEQVFCRICREGLHDVDYDYEMDGQGGANVSVHNVAGNNAGTTHNDRQVMTGNMRRTGDPSLRMMNEHNANAPAESIGNQNHTGASAPEFESVAPPPLHAQQANHPYASNPLMSPCECSGSMAFVHYLCIEQWRCRSHHPDAQNGLNCETCNTPYTLPPPPARPDVNQEEDWLEAMPPHVLAALRRPHPCWQLVAAIVRRRYLRPAAPVIMSPAVALYCRARRTLKKRGVSRRRWACSLCRRRARWKCVRCLRSYYCSRQCQNVSWHIVHKHVCYKPVRFWWSVVVYGLAFVYFFPGVLSYPLIYDLGLSFLWLSFVVTGIIGGGMATVMKKKFGIDIRGRALEATVVIMTCWLASVCWGLVWGFFGESDECKGVFNGSLQFNTLFTDTTGEDITRELGVVPSVVRYFVLVPAKKILTQMDNILLKFAPFITQRLCYNEDLEGINADHQQTCLKLTQDANPDFMTAKNGENCSSDVNTVVSFWAMAVCMHSMSYMMKRFDRIRRAAAAMARRPRPHQD